MSPELNNNYNHSNIHVNSSLQIAKLLLIPSNVYKEQYIRPYELNADQKSLDIFTNMFINDNSYGNNGISISNVANNLPNLLTKKHVPIDSAKIANGWGTERLRFIMEVITPASSTTEKVSYIQGYSEYYDPSITGKIDPNMTFFINSVLNVHRGQNPVTGEIIARVAENFNIIYNPDNSITVNNINDDLLVTRPKDVVDGLDSLLKHHDLDNNINIVDTRSNFTIDAKTTHRKHNLGVKHLTDTINKLNSSKITAEITNDYSDIYRDSAGMLNSNGILKTPILFELFNMSEFANATTFTMNKLLMIDPNVQNTTHLIPKGQGHVMRNDIMDTLDGADMATVNVETTIAATIADATTALMTDSLLSEVAFTVTNLTVDGSIILVPSDVKSLVTGLDTPRYANVFFENFKNVVMPIITQSGLLGLEIYVTSDLLGDTVVAIGVDGTPNIVYRIPTFCDSLYSPVINNSYGMSNLVTGFSEITSNILT